MNDFGINEETEVGSAIGAGLAMGAPQRLDMDGRFFLVRGAAGAAEVIDLEEHRVLLADHPRRKRSKVSVYTAEALVEYVNRHRTEGTEVWANAEVPAITAVINGDAINSAGWGDHFATLRLRKTDSWKAWERASGTMGSQIALAELLEERAPDIIDPPGADLLEIAQTFNAARSVDFKSTERLSTGEIGITYIEQTKASAGKSGKLTIPDEFTLALVPFDGSPAYKIIAKLRYRLSEGTLQIGFKLLRADDVLKAAFADVLTEVKEGIGHIAPIYDGSNYA